MRIATATLDVVASDHLAAFYGGLLGLAVEGGDDALAVAVGGARLVLRAAPHPVGLHHVAFGVAHDRLDAAESWLAGRVPLLEAAGATRVQWDVWRAEAIYAVDPAGLVLELIAFADLPGDGRRGAFSADELRGIAEVGVAVEDVPRAAATLAAIGIGPWAAPASRGFAAVGTRGASLIVVPRGRPWFPTDDAVAGSARVEVAFADAAAGVADVDGHVVRCLP